MTHTHTHSIQYDAHQAAQQAQCNNSLPNGWQTLYTPEGYAYYYNPSTQETSWELPQHGNSNHSQSTSYSAGYGGAVSYSAGHHGSYYTHGDGAATYDTNTTVPYSAHYSAANHGYNASSAYSAQGHAYSSSTGTTSTAVVAKEEGQKKDDSSSGGLAALAAYDDDDDDSDNNDDK